MAVILFCVLCNESYRSHGNVPYACPRCVRPTRWRTSPCADVPKVDWVLTPLDVMFLRINRIAPELELVEDDGA